VKAVTTQALPYVVDPDAPEEQVAEKTWFQGIRRRFAVCMPTLLSFEKGDKTARTLEQMLSTSSEARSIWQFLHALLPSTF
jgi:hypothetical protein